MTEIVAVDIGGTHARFALAEIADRQVVGLSHETVLKAAEHASLQTAWEAFAAEVGRPLPRAAGIAVAGPVTGEVLQLTNNPWVIRHALIPEKLGADRFALVNDLGAVGHAVAHLAQGAFRHLCGPERELPAEGVVSVIGLGTGLGVAQLVRTGGEARVVETEGGHIDFAPVDAIEDGLLVPSTAGSRRSASARGRGCPTFTRPWPTSRGARSRPWTTKRCGRWRWAAATAWRWPPLTASA